MPDSWDDFDDVIDQAMCEVMLNDEWRSADVLPMVLKPMLEKDDTLPAIKKHATRLVQLLDGPLADMPAGQRGDIANALIDLKSFVSHRGRDA